MCCPHNLGRFRYTDWVDEYVVFLKKSNSKYAKDLPYLSGEVVYSLRCNIIHQGTPNITKANKDDSDLNIDKFILIVRDEDEIDKSSSSCTYGKNLFDLKKRQLKVDIRTLCYYIKIAAKDYYDKNKDLFNFFNYTLVDEREERRQLRERKEKRGLK